MSGSDAPRSRRRARRAACAPRRRVRRAPRWRWRGRARRRRAARGSRHTRGRRSMRRGRHAARAWRVHGTCTCMVYAWYCKAPCSTCLAWATLWVRAMGGVGWGGVGWGKCDTRRAQNELHHSHPPPTTYCSKTLCFKTKSDNKSEPQLEGAAPTGPGTPVWLALKRPPSSD